MMSGIYLIFTEQKLTELLTYSVFVRVWYSQSIYAVFKSSGVTVLSKPTPVNDHRGAAVCSFCINMLIINKIVNVDFNILFEI